MTHGAFAEVFAQKVNFATGLDARIKIVFTVAALAINLLAPNISTPIAIATFCLVTLLAIKVPPILILVRLAMPLVMAVVVLITQIFFYGVTPLLTISIWGWHLVGHVEGLAHGVLIMCRVLAGVSLILFLSLSTPANKLLLAARWFRVPRTFTELALLTYRYIFVLIEEVTSIKEAQKVRLGYCNWRQSMRSLSTLGGSLIFRAYDRAERVFEAMSSRGYAGTMPISYRTGLDGRDRLAASCLAVLLLAFYLVGRLTI
ncbi:MAG: cobalt ECF transporter T component CbiQ [Chloroflexota bacterium]|nr:cobalt ECF transporter T component CbiQ [Chloroflexota bacterium]